VPHADGHEEGKVQSRTNDGASRPGRGVPVDPEIRAHESGSPLR